MILSYQIPEWVIYRNAAIALYEVEREIEQEANSKRKSGMGQKVLPSLLAKRERLLREVEPLKLAALAAERAALERMYAPRVSLASESQPQAVRAAHDAEARDLDIPAFLRRVA